jgi:hypothetical protein
MCISEVPGLEKQVSTPPASSVPIEAFSAVHRNLLALATLDGATNSVPSFINAQQAGAGSALPAPRRWLASMATFMHVYTIAGRSGCEGL